MKHLRPYNESYIKPNVDAFVALVEGLQKEIENIFSKINKVVGQGYYLKDGDRVFHKKESRDSDDGYYGTVVRNGSGFKDWYIVWDDPEVGKRLGRHPQVKYGADWRGGFNFLKAELKPEYDRLLIELKKFQDAKSKIFPDTRKVKCIESTSQSFQPNSYYACAKDHDGYFYVGIRSYGRFTQYDWERIRATDDGYTWVWENYEKQYAVFENEDIKEFLTSYWEAYKEAERKRSVQKRFDL